ncbi:MAG: tetratricopeptide repeat protein [Salibacteraceae bacterium]
MKYLRLLFCFFLMASTSFTKADALLDSTDFLLNANDLEPIAKVDQLNSFAFYCFGKDYEAGERCALLTDSLAQTLDYTLGMAEAIRLQSLFANHRGATTQALDLALKAYRLFENSTDSNGLAKCCIQLGRVYRSKGFWDESLRYNKEAFEISQILGEVKTQATALLNIGVVYDIQTKDSLALFYYNKALASFHEIKEALSIANCNTNIGHVFARQKNPDCKKYYQNALAAYREAGMACRASYPISGLAGYHYRLADYDSAIYYSERMEALGLECNNAQILADAYLNLGINHERSDHSREAEMNYRKSLEIALENEMVNDLREANQALYYYYDNLGHADSALRYMEAYLVYRDSIFDAQTTKKMARMESDFQYEFEKQDLEYRQQQERELLEATIARQQLLTIGVILILVLLSIAGISYYRLTRSRQKNLLQAAVIEEKERGLEAVFIATEEERKRIAKDLHDGIGQQLSALKMGFRKWIKSIDQTAATEAQRLESLMDSTAADTRTISHQMMPRTLTELGLIAAMEETLNNSLGPTAIRFEFEHFNLKERYEERIEIALYRIFQELITNVLRHSEATFTSVQLFQNENDLILLLEDNGRGLTNQPSDGIGLLNIRNRLSGLKGKFNLEPSPDVCTTATVSIRI